MTKQEIDELALQIAHDAILDFTKKVVIDPDEGEALKEAIIDAVLLNVLPVENI